MSHSGGEWQLCCALFSCGYIVVFYDSLYPFTLRRRHMTVVRLESPLIRLFVRQFRKASNKGNTDNRWFLLTNGQFVYRCYNRNLPGLLQWRWGNRIHIKYFKGHQ